MLLRARSGFTLIELAISMMLVYLLASIMLPQMKRVFDFAKTARATAEVRLIQAEVAQYIATVGKPPPTLLDIERSGMVDPWGSVYVYAPYNGGPPPGARLDQFGVNVNSDYDVYSSGPDRLSQPSLTAFASRDDVIRGGDGSFIGLATNY